MSTVVPLCLGIDLGTTNSCIAKYSKVPDDYPLDNPIVVKGKSANSTMPSMVTFKEGEIALGESSKKLKVSYPDTTFFSIKRLIGKDYNDPVIKADKRFYSYSVQSKGNRPVLKVQTDKYFTEERGSKRPIELLPEQISGMVLRGLMDRVKDEGTSITKAVITVPASFNKIQRESTKVAAKIAGFDPIDTISEPVAATIAYAHALKFSKETRFSFIFDFGGGTLDVAIVKIEGRTFTVMATAGDNNFGGVDVDKYLMEIKNKEIKEKYGIDVFDPENKRLLAELQEKCEEAKKQLSAAQKSEGLTVNINKDKESITYPLTFNRADIELFFKDNINKIIDPIDTVISSAKMNIKDITMVIVVGGSSNIPYVQDIITKKFGKEPTKPIDADEAIAKGAAIYGAFLEPEYKKDAFKINNVTPSALKIVTGTFKNKSNQICRISRTMIPENTPLPCTGEWVRIIQSNGVNKKKNNILYFYENELKTRRPSINIGKCSVDFKKEYEDRRYMWCRLTLDRDSKLKAEFKESENTPDESETPDVSKEITLRIDFTAEDITNLAAKVKDLFEAPDSTVDYQAVFFNDLHFILSMKNKALNKNEKKVAKEIVTKFKKTKNIPNMEGFDKAMYNKLKEELIEKIREEIKDFKCDKCFKY